MSNYILSPAAKIALIEIKEYTTKQWGAKQANAYLVQLRDRMRFLVKNPTLGKSRDEIKPGYFSFPEGKHVIFYRILKTNIEIIGIPHQNMDIETRLQKEPNNNTD